MKIYVSIQNGGASSFLELDVSESITAKEVLELSEVKKIHNQETGHSRPASPKQPKTVKNNNSRNRPR